MGLCRASKGILEKEISKSRQVSKSIEGTEGWLLEEGKLSKISSKESAKTNGSASSSNVGEVEVMSKRLANLASKISISSVDMRGAERVAMGDTEDCIAIGEMGGASLMVSMVLVTNESREGGLELGKDGESRIGELSALIKDKVALGVSSEGERGAILGKEVN